MAMLRIVCKENGECSEECFMWTWQESYGEPFNDCHMGWANEGMKPGEDCPGPGEYELTRIER